jgi:TonB family protein
MKKEPFRSLLITTILYIIFFGIMIVIEMEIKIFPSKDTEPIELNFMVSGNSDNPNADNLPPKLPSTSPQESNENAIATQPNAASFNAALVKVVDTTLKTNDTLTGTRGTSGMGSQQGSDSASGMLNGGNGDGMIYDISMVSEMPSFLGGGVDKFREWIVVGIREGDYIIKNTDKGTMIVNFTLNKRGDIEDITIVKGINKELDEQVVKVFASAPRWEPAKQQGHAVRVQYNMQIHFAN